MAQYIADENLPYFCTITVLDWTPVFIGSRYIQPVIDSLNYSRAHKGLRLFAYVIMPNRPGFWASDAEPHGAADPRCDGAAGR